MTENDRAVACSGGCDWTGTESDLSGHGIPDIFERVDAGETMPAGECPECGALAHLVEARGPVEPVEPPRQPVGYYCRRCKSDKLRWDAWAAYDPASQQMELADDFDYVICCSERCDGNETSIVICEIALDEHGNATRGKAIEGEFDDDKAAA